MAKNDTQAFSKELLDQLLAGRDPKTVLDSGGLIGELKKALAERMLNAEMDVHLDNEAEAGVANHRNGHSAKTVLTPKFFIAGTTDRDTTITESRTIFANAAGPKQAWWVEGAAHIDMQVFAKGEYEKQVLEFLAEYLR